MYFPYWQTSQSFEILLRVHAPYLTVGLHRYQCVIWDALLGLSLLRSACFCMLEKECKAFSFKWSSVRVKFPVWVECVSRKGNCITISIDSVSILKVMSIEFLGHFLKIIIFFFFGLILSVQDLQYEDSVFRQFCNPVLDLDEIIKSSV